MARPVKLSCDYFSHDATASQNEKLIYLESMFGDSGYAWYFKMLEALTGSDRYEIEWTEIKCAVYARRFNADTTQFAAFIVAATTPEVAAFTLENGRLFSPGLKKRLAIVDERRQKEADRIAARRQASAETPQIPIVAPTNPEVAPTNTQSKVKESKVKESIIITSSSSNATEPEKTPWNPITPDQGQAELENDTEAQNLFQKNYRIPRENYPEYLKDFIAEIRVTKETHPNLTAFKKHFFNWSAIRYQKTQRPPGRASPTNNQRTQYNQPKPFTSDKQAF